MAGQDMNVRNYMRIEFPSLPENVSLARTCVSAFVTQLDCTLEEIEEIKLVVSEAVSNCIIHAYENQSQEKIMVMASIGDERCLEIIVDDYGKGIADIKQAMEPAYSSDAARMGMGFTFMKSFMDDVEVRSEVGEGTSVILRRKFMYHDKEALA